MHIVVAHSLSRGENTSSSSQQLSSSPPKATFFDGRKEPLFISLSLSLSLSVLRAKTERKRYRKGVSFPSSLPAAEKIKKTEGRAPKKREKTKFFQHRLHGPKFSLSMMMRANKNAPPPFNKQRERRVDFKLAQKQPNVMDCYNASGRARVWTRCGSDRARFPDRDKERERETNFSPLQNFFSFSFCFWARKLFFGSQFRLEKLSLFQAVIK